MSKTIGPEMSHSSKKGFAHMVAKPDLSYHRIKKGRRLHMRLSACPSQDALCHNIRIKPETDHSSPSSAEDIILLPAI